MGQPGLILVDTHVVVWLALEPAKVSKKARSAIEAIRRSNEGVAISVISLFEIAIAESKGRIKLSPTLETFLAEIESRFVVLPITGKVCVTAVGLPGSYPRDPADRIIGATALVEGIPLITADDAIRRSKAVRAIW
jgi:PIN domain nuclease of toxin-antitoxin system